ncbi:PucR family transcriptional regulator [Rhodococcus sp. As11]|uniref:PucR family transcriptional regulator n=1 Tax=Rhodococcus sp. As11 TaxID=3029189 RepID=UPI003B7AB815
MTDMLPDRFRLVDLLLEPDLGLRLVTDADPNVGITGAHPIEIENPTRWLQPGSMMLTTGSRFPVLEHPQPAYRELIRELVGAGITALGYGVGVITEDIPRSLLDEAERHRFAVVAIPSELPFMEVVGRVGAAVQAQDSMLLRRTLQIQNHLLEAMTAEAPEADLVARLAGLLRSSVILYNEVGDVVASAGGAPVHLIRNQLRGREGRLLFRVGRWAVSAHSISPGDQYYWLALASKTNELSDPLTDPAVEVSLRLLNTIERTRQRATVENRARHTALVRALVSGDPAHADTVLEQLEMLRFGPDPDVRLLVLSAAPEYENRRWVFRANSLLEAVEADVSGLARDLGLTLLLARSEGGLVGVVPAGAEAFESWSANLPQGLRCGSSEPFTDPTRGPEKLREARWAWRAAERRGRAAQRFEDVGLADWLLAARDPEAALTRATAVLAPLLDGHEDLMDFLVLHLARELDVGRTARELNLHPNTVRHRVKRVEELLGCSLRSPRDVADVHLALEVLAERRTA